MTYIHNPNGVRQREPRVRDKAYLGFIAKLPCLGCMCRGRGATWPVEVCHIRTGYVGHEGWRSTGAGERPSDHRTYPGCPSCHRTGRDAQHGTNERAWFEELRVYPPSLCAALVAASKSHDPEMYCAAVIRRASLGEFPFPA